jgi:hypothetical protein
MKCVPHSLYLKIPSVMTWQTFVVYDYFKLSRIEKHRPILQSCTRPVGFEILTAGAMKSSILWI